MSRALQSERGVALVEALVAVAIAGTALVMFLSGMSSGLLATSQSDRLSTAHELARSQIETTKAAAYQAPPATYPSIPAPSGYAVTATASAIAGAGPGIELIQVDVSRDGVVVFTLQDYKVDR
jgi:type II secretory pathway pseudopilin PulG